MKVGLDSPTGQDLIVGCFIHQLNNKILFTVMELGIMAVLQLYIMHIMPESCMYSNYGGQNTPEHNAHVKY